MGAPWAPSPFISLSQARLANRRHNEIDQIDVLNDLNALNDINDPNDLNAPNVLN